ncbi:hypothetical protein KM043_014060 [Ampulex compressa]|nr:hypothetical protein KM043_014060 [Ampulex compressa]
MAKNQPTNRYDPGSSGGASRRGGRCSSAKGALQNKGTRCLQRLQRIGGCGSDRRRSASHGSKTRRPRETSRYLPILRSAPVPCVTGRFIPGISRGKSLERPRRS